MNKIYNKFIKIVQIIKCILRYLKSQLKIEKEYYQNNILKQPMIIFNSN